MPAGNAHVGVGVFHPGRYGGVSPENEDHVIDNSKKTNAARKMSAGVSQTSSTKARAGAKGPVANKTGGVKPTRGVVGTVAKASTKRPGGR
ncbi:hypothetical protein [Cylindrospermum sp. FACHB-282]|uniref:hypothetical protein n=1 Tax=Cylindrospermum sp. FACHB-282 TaxID=2692794 RepID=UPI00168920A6|nr:hypothetical protein [Cylindrospermum sp. FACHB-282]MBD2388828.1 hypothetical protein [Cylindrospermum sp. FACHB-282]